MPRNSSTVAIVFAVNWPPHAPAPGQATSSSSCTSSLLMLPGRGGADGLEDVLDRDVAAAEAPRRDRAVVEDEPGHVEARERHHRGRDRLVAADEADEAVEQVAAHDELDRVGDHLARDERGAHPLRAHRDAVADGDRVELDRRAAGLEDAAPDVARLCPQTPNRRQSWSPFSHGSWTPRQRPGRNMPSVTRHVASMRSSCKRRWDCDRSRCPNTGASADGSPNLRCGRTSRWRWPSN